MPTTSGVASLGGTSTAAFVGKSTAASVLSVAGVASVASFVSTNRIGVASMAGSAIATFVGRQVTTAPVTNSIYIDMELDGRDNGWTTIMDVITGSGSFERGLPGSGVADCVADPGSFTFKLNNSAGNSVSTISYYSPDHASCLPGFAESIGIRVRVTVAGVSYVRWTGIIDDIEPAPGTTQSRLTRVSCVGWFEIAARTRLAELPIAVDQRGDQLFQTLMDSLSSTFAQPRAIEKDTGLDTYPIAFDRIRDENTKLREELYRIAISGLDKFWVRGDGTVVYESRNRRVGASSDRDTFTDNHGIIATRGRSGIINHAHLTANPRKAGTAGSVLYSLDNPIELPLGQLVEFIGPWRDPNNKDVRVGAVTLIALVSGTDYIVNSAADGSGSNLTASVVVTEGASGNATQFGVTLGGSVSGWLITAQKRGTPLLDYGASTMQDLDQANIDRNGDLPEDINMPYQDDLILALEAAQYIVFTRKGRRTVVSGFIRVVPLTESTSLLRSLQRDISDRVAVTDPVTGINKSFFIDNIKESYGDGYITTEWAFSPYDDTVYWHVEVVGQSEVDSMRLGFGYVLGHTDVALINTHGDVAFANVAHTDTHTDDAAVLHGDGATHGDSPAVSHSDTAHADVTHEDAHADDPHGDTPHQDAHSDYHADNTLDGHQDEYVSVHYDVAFVDEAPENAHGDVTHQDQNHGDVTAVSHSDNASHNDVAAVTHGDVSHADVTHQDVTHTDTHGDQIHGDVN